MRKPIPALASFALGASCLFLWGGASCDPKITQITAPTQTSSCADHPDCGVGEVCVSGLCRPGECVPGLEAQCGADAPAEVAAYCCAPWQVCSPLNECLPNPNSPVGSQCLISDDCKEVGQFCSGGTCYSPQGRDACTASHQCPGGERCDRKVFLCVPDNGGCTFAGAFAELACESGQLCDTETGYCVAPSGPECGSADDCRAGQQCDNLGRCVQCVADADCGPGTECNEGTGSCVSTNRCESDEDCTGNRRCVPATRQCETPECERDNDCDDNRERCDEQTYKCYLPLATCQEADEPNDSVSAATEIPLSGYAGTLCRGNTDFLSFPIQPDKRYRARVSFINLNADGVSVALLGSEGLILDQEAVSFFGEVTVTGISAPDESGRFALRITGSGAEADEWSYTVTIEETQAPQQVSCDDEVANQIEPNNDFASASTLTPGQPQSFARCGLSDVDYYRVVVPDLHGVDITVEHEREDGDLDIYLYDAPSMANRIDASSTSNGTERVEAPEGKTEFWLRVERWGTSGSANQTYTVTATAVPRPAACAADLNEPDTTPDRAGALTVDAAPIEPLRCNPGDVDFFRVTVPPSRGAQVRIDFNHSQGDLRLDLLDANEMVVASSNRSLSSEAAAAYEVMDVPFAATEQTYFARVRLHQGTGSAGQVYAISATTYDAALCTVSEPVANNTHVEGRCVGAFDDMALPCAGERLPLPLAGPELATCAAATGFVPGCATACGAGDADWYRVGKLNNGQTLSASLDHDPALGRLRLALVRLNANPSGTPNPVLQEGNAAGNGRLELSLAAPYLDEAFAREYAVLVEPTGNGSYQAQPYSLSIYVGEPCNADAYEGTTGNQTPATATSLARGSLADARQGTLCGSDRDLYSLYAFPGEKLRVTLEGVPGQSAFIGTAAPTAAQATSLPCARGMVEGESPDTRKSAPDAAETCEALTSGLAAPAAGTARVLAEALAPAEGPLYITVDKSTAAAIGAYTLRVELLAPSP